MSTESVTAETMFEPRRPDPKSVIRGSLIDGSSELKVSKRGRTLGELIQLIGGGLVRDNKGLLQATLVPVSEGIGF